MLEMEAQLQGRKRFLWVKARPLCNSKCEVVGAIETLRDITERKELEGQLRQAQKMEAFGQLAAGVAHDFNNLLTVIQGNASILETREDLDPEWATATSEIGAASERAANLTRQLLTFSKRQLFQPKAVDLNEVVANMTRMLRRLIGEHIILEARYGTATAMVNADLGMMEQIMVNLAVNSRDAMPDGGRLVLETGFVNLNPEEAAGQSRARPGDFIRLEVSDTGEGIAPENLPRIFEPFFTTKEPGKGTGLGLATVFGIVERHHGWIEIQSEVGVGTTFQIFLPRMETPALDKQTEAEVLPLRGGNETILLVEDETTLRQLFSRILEQSGYHVYEADSGVAALRLWEFHRGEINMVLTDMVMPGGIGGRELAERMLADKPGLKVIYCSGYTDDMLGKDSILRVNSNFLEKPFTPESLLRRMRDCLDAAP
jgi:signal transduction histidine kinase